MSEFVARRGSREPGNSCCSFATSFPIGLNVGERTGVPGSRRPQQRLQSAASEGTGDLSTAQATLSSTWKQEVNRRIAEHKSRKGPAALKPEAQSAAHRGSSHRAAEAAARVAARFAKAPSYSEMLATEARVAGCAAELASPCAALEIQASAESVLSGHQRAAVAEPLWELPMAAVEPALEVEPSLEPVSSASTFAEPLASPPVAAAPPVVEAAELPSFSVRWERELPARISEPASTHGIDNRETRTASWSAMTAIKDPFLDLEDPATFEGIVEPAQPIHANLIEFPRELVATRKVRPRIAEGPYAGTPEPGVQLSIFEVEPGTVSTEHLPAAAPQAAPSIWVAPEWSGMELEAQPAEEIEVAREPQPQTEPQIAPVATAPALQLAAMHRRLLAAVMDTALIVAAFLSAAVTAAVNAKVLPGVRTIEIAASAGLLLIGAFYQAFFLTLTRATPGMKYARVRLSTFDGQIPALEQRWNRLGALFLSLLPMGLGSIWALFDENHLSWHDRISQTYLRNC